MREIKNRFFRVRPFGIFGILYSKASTAILHWFDVILNSLHGDISGTFWFMTTA